MLCNYSRRKLKVYVALTAKKGGAEGKVGTQLVVKIEIGQCGYVRVIFPQELQHLAMLSKQLIFMYMCSGIQIALILWCKPVYC